MQSDILISTQELLSYWIGILTVGCTAAAAVFGSLSRSFSSRVNALKEEMRTRPTSQSQGIWLETIPSLERAEDKTGKAAVLFTAAAAVCGCLFWWFSSNVSEMKEEARIRFEREFDLKIEAAKQGTAYALAEAANARKDTVKLEVEAARLREQAALTESKIKAAEARVAEANERSAKAGEGTAKALAEAASAKENTSRLDVEAASLREQAARAEKELIEVQERIKSRRVTNEQRTRLLQALKSSPKGSIVVDTVMGDGEALMFAGQIRDILRESGWGDVHLTRTMYTGNPIGLSILYGGKPSIAIPLADAFDSVGIKTKLSSVPQAPEGAVKILVGMKPNP